MPTEPERKGQLYNDVQAIYEILGRVEASQDTLLATQKRHGNRLNEIDGKLDRIIEALENK